MIPAAQTAADASAAIQGYSREKQGEAAAARGRAAAGMQAARQRVAGDYARNFEPLYAPTGPGRAVNAALTPAGPGQAGAARAGGEAGMSGLSAKMDQMISELQRIRTQ
jgi:hypothetical protein